MSDEIRFDDIEAIVATITDEWSDWGRDWTITQEMIDAFADLTDDHQWIHVDVERAQRESPFGGPIAHGFLTLSLLPSLQPKMVKLAGVKNAVNFGSEGSRFLSPVPAGATIHARARLVRAEQHRAGTLLTTEMAIHVVGNDKPALTYKMQILYQG